MTRGWIFAPLPRAGCLSNDSTCCYELNCVPLNSQGGALTPGVQRLEVGLWEMMRLWELDHKEGWAPKNWNFWTVVLEKTLESPLDCKGITVSPEGLMLKLKLQYSGHLVRRANSLGKTLMLGDCRKEKGTTEDEVTGWHHRLDGHEFEQAPGIGDGQGGMECCTPWGHKEWQTAEWLKRTEPTAN